MALGGEEAMRGSGCRGGRVEEGGECRECSSVEGVYDGDDADVALDGRNKECGEEKGDEEERGEGRIFARGVFTVLLVLASLSTKEPDAADARVFVGENESIDTRVAAGEECCAERAYGCCRGEVAVLGKNVLVVGRRANEGQEEGGDRVGERVRRESNDIRTALC